MMEQRLPALVGQVPALRVLARTLCVLSGWNDPDRMVTPLTQPVATIGRYQVLLHPPQDQVPAWRLFLPEAQQILAALETLKDPT